MKGKKKNMNEVDYEFEPYHNLIQEYKYKISHQKTHTAKFLTISKLLNQLFDLT